MTRAEHIVSLVKPDPLRNVFLRDEPARPAVSDRARVRGIYRPGAMAA